LQAFQSKTLNWSRTPHGMSTTKHCILILASHTSTK
jgi:hypothetical protein